MTQTHLVLFIFYSFLQSNQCISQLTKKAAGNVIGVYDGRTPCKELAAQINEKTTTDCMKIKWRLILYKDSATGNPTTYELLGFVFKRDNPQIGKWHVIKGSKSKPWAIIYQLDLPGRGPLFLLKGDDNILFFMDKDKNLLVGNRDFSYTLNRVDKNL